MALYESFPVLAQAVSGTKYAIPDQWIIVLAIAIVCITAIVLGIIGAITTILRRRAELELKRDLAERGMTADEIATIVESKPNQAARK